MNPHERKAAESGLRRKREELQVTLSRMQEAADRAAVLQSEIDVLEKRLVEAAATAAAARHLDVTEHALLRYLERVAGQDLAAIEANIRRSIGPVAATLGDGKYPLEKGGMAVVKDNAVVTILK